MLGRRGISSCTKVLSGNRLVMSWRRRESRVVVLGLEGDFMFRAVMYSYENIEITEESYYGDISLRQPSKLSMNSRDRNRYLIINSVFLTNLLFSLGRITPNSLMSIPLGT